MSNLYAEDILYWARDTRFRGMVENPDAQAHRENPSCGDALMCTVMLDGGVGGYGVVSKIRFEGTGCVICLASATVLAEHVEGTMIESALALDKTNMVEWLTCDVGPMRTNCMMLALRALHGALEASDPERRRRV